MCKTMKNNSNVILRYWGAGFPLWWKTGIAQIRMVIWHCSYMFHYFSEPFPPVYWQKNPLCREPLTWTIPSGFREFTNAHNTLPPSVERHQAIGKSSVFQVMALRISLIVTAQSQILIKDTNLQSGFHKMCTVTPIWSVTNMSCHHMWNRKLHILRWN